MGPSLRIRMFLASVSYGPPASAWTDRRGDPLSRFGCRRLAAIAAARALRRWPALREWANDPRPWWGEA